MRNVKPKRKPEESIDRDEILPEYDFSKARPNEFAGQIQPGSTMMVLDPDIAAVFPNPGEVNEALRALAGVIRRNRDVRQ